MALGSEVVYFVGLHFLHDANQVRRIGHIAVMEKERDALLVGVPVQVVDPLRIEKAAAPLQAVHLIPFRQQQFRQVGAVLSGDSGDECFLL